MEPGSRSRADWLLAGIASPLLLSAVLAPALSMPLALALGLGSIPAVGGVGYALFRSPTARTHR